MELKCKQLIDSYLNWLRDRISVVEMGGVCEITTPFLDRHNDRLQIYVVHKENGFRLTDDGYILSDLQSCGCPIDTPNRKKTLETILNGFGVHERDGELCVDGSPSSFAQKKHALIQAMLSVNDMFMMAKPRVSTPFLEDISHFLEQNDVRFSANVGFTGKTGFVHKFDFLIPRSKQSPERLVRAINNPNREATTNVLFAWTDTREVRSKDSAFYVILNDAEREISADFTSAFHEYDVRVVPWSQRAQHIQELAA